MKKIPWLLWMLCPILLGACRPSVQPEIATAQATRASAMATHISQDLRATKVAAITQATATAQVIQDSLRTASQWSLMIADPFDENVNEWASGEEVNSELASIRWEMSQGKYRWEAQATDSFVWWVTPTMADVDDFYLSAEMRQVTGPPHGEFGLIFRRTEAGDYYLFEISDQQQFAVFYQSEANWETLLDWRESPLILSGAANRLEMVAQGAQFHFFINGRYAASLTDGRLQVGKVGLLAGLANAGDRATWEFDNFELRNFDDPNH